MLGRQTMTGRISPSYYDPFTTSRRWETPMKQDRDRTTPGRHFFTVERYGGTFME